MESLQGEWAHARGLTVDLLRSCSVEDLSFELHPGFGPIWKQFRHVGRVQEDYLAALQAGEVRFESGNGSYDGGASKLALLDYFERLERRHAELFDTARATRRIDWFGESITRETLLLRLLTHETLHHGQLILFWRAVGKPFPKSWTSWGQSSS